MRDDYLTKGSEMLEAAGCKTIYAYDTIQTLRLDIHHMGGARMGQDSRTSLPKEWNQMHLARNVFVTDGACITSVGNQNPSITFMALTAQAVDRALSEFKKGNL